jgi:hypothetical protein
MLFYALVILNEIDKTMLSESSDQKSSSARQNVITVARAIITFNYWTERTQLNCLTQNLTQDQLNNCAGARTLLEIVIMVHEDSMKTDPSISFVRKLITDSLRCC